jgi:3-oxoacyl-[acyl-carrier-protein] synthase II
VPERVVVTGVGVVSPLGPAPAFWEKLVAGSSGIAAVEDADARTPRLEARARDWNARDHVKPALLRRMDRCSQMVVTACRLALGDAELTLAGTEAEAAGVVLGTAFGNLTESEDFLRGLFAKGPTLANPLTFPNLVLNAPTGYVAMDLGIRGPSLTVVRGEASGEAALALAYDTIVTGQADVLLAGGVDELSPALRQIHADLHLLSPDDGGGGGEEWSSPFDRDRNGMVMGEGAAMLLLESETHARARGARVRAELVGHAIDSMKASPHDWPTVATAAAARDLAPALAALGFRSAPRGDGATLVVSCANSTRRLDAVECARLATLLGDTDGRTLVTSLKGAVGDFGAAGALGAAAAVLALGAGDVPRLGALRTVDRECTLPLARLDTPPPAGGVGEALVTAMPRGGGGVSVLFRKP